MALGPSFPKTQRQFLRSFAAGLRTDDARIARLPFLLRFTYATGLRISEQAKVTVCDLRPQDLTTDECSAPWLRHTFGSHAILPDMALDVGQHQLSHASLVATSVYVHTEDERRAGERITQVCIDHQGRIAHPLERQVQKLPHPFTHLSI